MRYSGSAMAKESLQKQHERVTRQEKEARAAEEAKEAAKLLGRLGGLKGGPARARALTAKRRSQIARRAANVRWGLDTGEMK